MNKLAVFASTRQYATLSGLPRDECAPARVALGPQVFAFVREPLAELIDDDAERDAVEPRDDAAVELRRARIDRDRMAGSRIADRLRAGVEHRAQRRAGVVRRAADDEVVGRVAPGLLQPREVRLEAAAGEDERLCADGLVRLKPDTTTVVRLKPDTTKYTIAHVDRDDLGVVEHVDAHPLRCRVVGVHQRFAAAEKERVRPRQVQRASQGRLKADAVLGHPLGARLRSADQQSRQRLVGLVRVDAQQIGVELVLGIRPGEHGRRRVVRAAQVPRVAAVAAAKLARGTFERRSTRAPASRAVSAAHSAAFPPPTTTTSYSRASVIDGASPAMVRRASPRRRAGMQD